MDEVKLNEIGQWLIKASHDLGSAKCLLGGDTPYLDTAVYHCQQTAEKALKAYLTLKDTPFLKIHDLSVLVEQCMELDSTFDQLKDIPEILNPYATAFRYPGDVLEPEPSDVDEAYELASMVFEFVLMRMPEELKKQIAKLRK